MNRMWVVDTMEYYQLKKDQNPVTYSNIGILVAIMLTEISQTGKRQVIHSITEKGI